MGQRDGAGRDRRLDPARERAAARRCPDAEIILFGTTDGFANIHAPNERVLVDEFEKAVVAEAEFFRLYAEKGATAMSEAAAEKRGFTAKMLDGIETVGNKVPHPAIIFAGLCVLVIVVSAVLAAFNISVTYEVAELPPIEAPVEELGGSTQPEVNAPPSYEEPRGRDPHRDDRDQEPAVGRRAALHLLVVRDQLRRTSASWR